jgi:hypothetical protein
MTSGHGLALVILAFMAILAAVLAMAFRERRLAQRIDAADTVAAGASDARILVVIFAAIPGGMLLTAITAWLVYF